MFVGITIKYIYLSVLFIYVLHGSLAGQTVMVGGESLYGGVGEVFVV